MKGGTRPLGYTIIEVMIVLAVSGLMFVIAANFISGRQAKTAFAAGTNDFSSSMQGLITEIASGQYSGISFGCTVAGSGSTAVITISATDTNPTVRPCVYVGKLLQFNDGAISKYAVYSLAAARQQTTLDDTYPIISTIGSPQLDLTQHLAIPQSLDATIVKLTDISGGTVLSTTSASPPTSVVSAIGFAQTIPQVDSNGDYVTGSQPIGLYYTVDNLAAGAKISLQQAASVDICLWDGSRYADVTIGDASNGGAALSVNLTVVASC